MRWQKDRPDSQPMPGNIGQPSLLCCNSGRRSSRQKWQIVNEDGQAEQCNTPRAGSETKLILDLHPLHNQCREASAGGLKWRSDPCAKARFYAMQFARGMKMRARIPVAVASEGMSIRTECKCVRANTLWNLGQIWKFPEDKKSG